MKYYDELDRIEKETRKAEALALATATLAAADYRADYVELVGDLAAEAAREANKAVCRLLEAMRKENAACSTSASGAEDDSANGYRVGQPHERV